MFRFTFCFVVPFVRNENAVVCDSAVINAHSVGTHLRQFTFVPVVPKDHEWFFGSVLKIKSPVWRFKAVEEVNG